jgi:hypothetical protein
LTEIPESGRELYPSPVRCQTAKDWHPINYTAIPTGSFSRITQGTDNQAGNFYLTSDKRQAVCGGVEDLSKSWNNRSDLDDENNIYTGSRLCKQAPWTDGILLVDFRDNCQN